MTIVEKLEKWKKSGFISALEVEFTRFLLQISPEENENVLLAAAACVYAQSNGHVCLDFQKWDDEFLFNEPGTDIKITERLKSDCISALEKSVLVSSGKELQPLALEGERLYLHRFWKFEEELTEWINKKSSVLNDIAEEEKKALRSLLVPKGVLFETNWQHLAVMLSFMKDLVVISGGPGTGKTYTVLNIIAAHKIANAGKSYRIALAAPTGKAARRLMDSIEEGKEKLSKEHQSEIDISDSALTVHKLLGANFRGSQFKYNEQNKLPYDMVVIDEASMLDITMWVRLIRAIGITTKLVVLGDKDQLASVEAGSILGDICGGTNTFSPEIADHVAGINGMEVPTTKVEPAINDCVVFLTKSYRFGEESGIGNFAQAVNNSDAKQAISILEDPNFGDVNWLQPTVKNLEMVVSEYAVEHYKDYISIEEERLEASNRKKILCALRRSDFGIEAFNARIEHKIRQNLNLLTSREWYQGRIVMATRNDAVLKIRNGEIGIYEEGRPGNIKFEGEQAIKISSTRLKEYEPAFSITIHKSQGSEFDEVAIILPSQINSILSKEILYTAVTRARRNTLIIATEEILKKTIERSVSRNSGVKNKIWGAST